MAGTALLTQVPNGDDTNVPYVKRDGDEVYQNDNWDDNKVDHNDRVLVRHFAASLCLWRRVFIFDSAFPPIEHASDLGGFLGKHYQLRFIDALKLVQGVQHELQDIVFCNSALKMDVLIVSRRELRERDLFDELGKQGINTVSQRVAQDLGNVTGKDPVPDCIEYEQLSEHPRQTCGGG